MTLSIRARLTAWYSALMITALAVFAVGVLLIHARWGRQQFDSELASLVTATSHMVEEELGESGDLGHAVAEVRNSLDIPDRTIAILDAAGTPLAANWRDFAYDPAGDQPTAAVPERLATLAQHGKTWRVLTRRGFSNGKGFMILAAGALDQLDRQHALLLRVLLVAAPLAVLLTGSVCWTVASAALRPVTTMATQAEAITVRSIAWHLDAPASGDELGQLATAFNRLLARLAAASETQRQFMADASHELRTPVSIVQTTTEVTLGREGRQEAEYRDALAIISEQTTRLKRLVEDMLVLARADATGFRLTRRPLYLDDIAAECVRALSAMAAARGITLSTTLESDVDVSADDDLIRRLTTNLIANALQYTPPGGSVTVAVSRDRDGAMLTVSDTGRGIPLADRERVFERFVRLDPARSAITGAGLGLPIARWIAEQHGGHLTLEENADGGCRFVLHLSRSVKEMPA